MERWLGLRPGSVSAFGLINDTANHVHLFLDSRMRSGPATPSHERQPRHGLCSRHDEFMRYLAAAGSGYEFLELY